MRALLVLLLVSLWPAQSVTAQDPTVDETGKYLTLQFDETTGEKLENFIHLARQILDVPISYDPTEMNNVIIRIIGTPKVEREYFFEFFQAVLKAYDFVVADWMESGGFYKIQKIQAAGPGRGANFKSQAPIVPAERIHEYANSPATLITTSIPLKYIDGRAAMATFNPYFDTQIEGIRNVENSNSLVITGFGTNVWGAYQLVGLVDVPPFKSMPTIVKRRLDHASVDEVEPVLTELLAAAQGLRPGQTSSPAAAGAAGLQEVEPRIIVDLRSNSLIVSGEEEMVERIESWVDILDVEVEPRGFTHVVRLKNTDAQSMEQVLDQVLQNEASAQANRGGNSGGTNSLEITPSVVADPTSNSIVITASDRKYAEIVETLRQLDVRRRQVLIECAIIETSTDLNDVFSAGVAAADEDIGGFGSNFGTPLVAATDDNGDPDFGQTFVDVGNGGTFAKISEGAIPIPIFLQWLRGETETHVLSRPSLLTNDNEEAELATQEETFYQVNTVNQNSTSENFESVQAGIRLGVSPTISAGNYLRLTVKLEVSDFSAASSGLPNAPPDKNIREIETPITVPDGSTVILGGLVSKSTSESDSKVPILGDLPLIGWLFRSSSDRTRDLYLYVFITAYIIDTDFALLDEISQARMADVTRLGGDVSELRGSLPSDPDADALQLLAGLDAVFDMPTVAVPTSGERGVAKAVYDAPAAAATALPANAYDEDL